MAVGVTPAAVVAMGAIVETEAGALRIPGTEIACHPELDRVCLRMSYHAFPGIAPHPSAILTLVDSLEM